MMLALCLLLSLFPVALGLLGQPPATTESSAAPTNVRGAERRSLHELAPVLFQAQDPAANNGRRPGAGPGPITLNPDDVQAFPEPPAGINAERGEVPHG